MEVRTKLNRQWYDNELTEVDIGTHMIGSLGRTQSKNFRDRRSQRSVNDLNPYTRSSAIGATTFIGYQAK